MDWTSVVEWNAKRLQRILAMLVAMAGLDATPSSPLVGEDGSARRGAGLDAWRRSGREVPAAEAYAELSRRRR